MRYLISGKKGQLAQAFIRRLEKKSSDFTAPDELHFDITDLNRVVEVVRAHKPDVLINCAAYNFVDRAEEESDKAFGINATGPKNLAFAAQKHDVFLVHFGSDYVFDGFKEYGLYEENDSTNPFKCLRQEQAIRREIDYGRYR